MLFDYSKLRGRITEKFGMLQTFAKALKMSPQSLSCKLNNRVDWRQEEMANAMRVLDIPFNEVDLYFFKELVQ